MNKIGKHKQNSQNKNCMNKIKEPERLCYKRAKSSIQGGLLYISKNFQLPENSLVHHKSPVKKSNNSTKIYQKSTKK